MTLLSEKTKKAFYLLSIVMPLIDVIKGVFNSVKAGVSEYDMKKLERAERELHILRKSIQRGEM